LEVFCVVISSPKAITILTPYLQGTAQRFALLALGRAAERRPIGKMIRLRKMLENAAESPVSSARFVGQVLQDGFEFELDAS